MGQPRPFNRITSYTDYSAANPSRQQPGAQLDAEFDAVKSTTDDIRTNIAKIQRDDGELANESVGMDQLAPDAVAYLGSTGSADVIAAINEAGAVATAAQAGALAAQAAAEAVRATFASKTLTELSALAVPDDVTALSIAGISTVGDVGAGLTMVFDATVDAGYVAANPTTSFLDTAGRGFRQARRKATDVDASDGTTVQANLDQGGSAIQPQTGAVRRKTQNKNLGFVDVRDYMTDADRASVEAGTLVDTSYAFQAAFDACSGKASASTQFGRKLRIPAGRYLIDTGVVFTWRNSSAIIDAGDSRKLTIEGDGSANTIIFCDISSGIAFDIRGYGNADGTELDFSMSGISIFQNGLGSTRNATGLRTKQISRVWLQDVKVNYFNIGYDFGDVIYLGSMNCTFGGNNGGATAAVDVFSNPNVINFTRCNFGGNQVYGLQATASANLHVLTCAFEGIGTDNTAGADQACIKLINGPAEGGHQATIENCYFENTYVYADVRVEWGTENGGTVRVAGCSFRRTDSTRYATRHIAMSQVGTGQMYLTLDGNSYKYKTGSYTPGSNPCWEVLSTPILIDARNEQYVSSELPALNGIPALRNCGLEIVAEGFVNADGTTSKLVNCTLSKTGTGSYAVTFTKSPVDANFHVDARQSNSFGHCSDSSPSTSGVTILTSDAGGNSSDKAFDFTITGRRFV